MFRLIVHLIIFYIFYNFEQVLKALDFIINIFEFGPKNCFN
jgi:hypothetical protein